MHGITAGCLALAAGLAHALHNGGPEPLPAEMNGFLPETQQPSCPTQQAGQQDCKEVHVADFLNKDELGQPTVFNLGEDEVQNCVKFGGFRRSYSSLFGPNVPDDAPLGATGEQGAVHKLQPDAGGKLTFDAPANVTTLNGLSFVPTSFRFFCGQQSSIGLRESFWAAIPCKVKANGFTLGPATDTPAFTQECEYDMPADQDPGRTRAAVECKLDGWNPIQRLEFVLTDAQAIGPATVAIGPATVGQQNTYRRLGRREETNTLDLGSLRGSALAINKQNYFGIDKFTWTWQCGVA